VTAVTAIFPRAYFPPDVSLLRAAMPRTGIRALAVLLLCGATPVPAQQIHLTLDDLEAPGFSAKALKARLQGTDSRELVLEIGTISIGDRNWKNVRLQCAKLIFEYPQIDCAAGTINVGEKIPLSFSYSGVKNTLDVVLRPAPRESWRLQARFGNPDAMFKAIIDNGKLARLASWLPATLLQPAAGTFNGEITYSGSGRANAQLLIEDLAFSDASGLHAGEKIRAGIEIQAEQKSGQWHWQSRLEWTAGGVFWQPLFVNGAGQVLNASGLMNGQRLNIERGRLAFSGAGDFDFSAAFDRSAGRLAEASIRTSDLDIAAFYEKLLKPALQATVLGDLRWDGRADIVIGVKDGVVAAAEMVLKRVSVEDKGRRFALFGLEGSVPWQRDRLTRARLKLTGGELLRVPFGAVDLPLELRGMGLRASGLEIPVLDGRISVGEFATSGEGPEWRWRFSGNIAPISMERLTAALGVTVMRGTLSAAIPTVSYQQSTLKVGGALLFKVFDGEITANNLVLESPLGRVPRLTADIAMHNLDLDLLTRAYSFGNMSGRIDAQIAGLELVNWQPVQFDARIMSSAGDYPRKISQAAVQNISALGGAGAATAIQRSFLRFFEQFGYEKLGLSCKLRNNVCEMGGVEDAPQGYLIVKGGGIPAISVIGYNRQVDWRELVDRLKRITQDNVRTIVN
jgi:hypothetical protein